MTKPSSTHEIGIYFLRIYFKAGINSREILGKCGVPNNIFVWSSILLALCFTQSRHNQHLLVVSQTYDCSTATAAMDAID
jgi:hypothetical protein